MLKEILKKIKEQEDILETEVDRESPTFRMLIGNKVKAPDEIKNLKEQYKEELKKRILAAVAYGPESASLAEEAKSTYEMIITNSDAIVRNAMVGSSLGYYLNKSFGPDTFGIVMQAVERDLENTDIPMPTDVRYSSSLYDGFLTTEEDLYTFGLLAVENVFGMQAVVHGLLEDIAKKALTEGFVGDILPVMVMSHNETDARKLSAVIRDSVIMQAGGDDSPEGVVLVTKDAESIEAAMEALKNKKSANVSTKNNKRKTKKGKGDLNENQ